MITLLLTILLLWLVFRAVRMFQKNLGGTLEAF